MVGMRPSVPFIRSDSALIDMKMSSLYIGFTFPRKQS